MKFNVLFVLFLACVLLSAPGFSQQQEDEVKTQNGVYKGVIQNATPSGVSIRLSGTGNQITIPHSAIIDMRVNEPKVVTEGVKAYEAGRMPEAARYLQRALEQFQALETEWAVKSVVYYGRASLVNGDYENAERAFKAFLAWYPADSMVLDARLGLAQIDAAKGEYDVALEKLEEIAAPFAAELKPAPDELPYVAETYLSIGKCLEAQEKYGEALNAVLKVIALYPDEKIYPEALYRSGLLFAKAGNLKRAESTFDELLRDYPSSSFASSARRERDNIRIQLTEEASDAS